MTGAEHIAQERKEQIEKHGFEQYIDSDFYKKGELVQAAMYAITLQEIWYPVGWGDWWRGRMTAKKERMTDREFQIEQCKIAGALLAAEIDRLQHNQNEG